MQAFHSCLPACRFDVSLSILIPTFNWDTIKILLAKSSNGYFMHMQALTLAHMTGLWYMAVGIHWSPLLSSWMTRRDTYCSASSGLSLKTNPAWLTMSTLSSTLAIKAFEQRKGIAEYSVCPSAHFDRANICANEVLGEMAEPKQVGQSRYNCT